MEAGEPLRSIRINTAAAAIAANGDDQWARLLALAAKANRKLEDNL